jgi:hypothetical protein
MDPESSPAVSRYALARHVRFTVIDGTAMLMDGKQGRYLGLNEVGTRIFELAAAGAAAEEVAANLEKEFAVHPQQVRDDVQRMIVQLEREGILERRREVDR